MAKHSASGQSWEAQRRRVLGRDGWTCAYCVKPLEGQDATVDHVSPISLTPDHDYRDDELVASCRSCNAIKSNKTMVRMPYANPRWFPHGLSGAGRSQALGGRDVDV